MQNYLNVEYVFFLIYSLLTGGGARVTPESFFASEFYGQLVALWGLVTIISTLVSLVLLTIFLYAAYRLKQIRDADDAFYANAVLLPDDYDEPQEMTRWGRIEALYEGGDEAHWRQAIIEADIMLDDMLTVQGYDGQTIGEKLKTVESADFTTLEYAWAAHKVRNNIAHQGQGYILTEREASQALKWYRKVFDEFHFN